MPELSANQRRAWRNLADSVRRYRLELAMPPSDPGTVEEVRSWLAPALPSVQDQVRDAAAELRQARARTTSMPRAGGDASWKALEDALRKVEQDLRSAPTLRMRLDEGRRSLMPKIEAVVHQHLEPQVSVKGKNLHARLHPKGLEALRAELPGWVAGWAEYTFQWVDHDLGRELELAWSPRELDLPVPPPALAPLVAPAIDSTIEFPDVELKRDGTKVWSGMARHARSLAYTLMSAAFLVGVQRPTMVSEGDEGGSSINFVVVLGMLGVLFYSWYVASDERRKNIERLEGELRQKAEQATRDAIRQWLDRWADKLQEHARDALLARRKELVQWYRQEVVARREVMRRQEAAEKAAAERARLELPKLQDNHRNLERAEAALQELARAMEAS
ncbi:MAG: hypothetical protein EP330_09185 [Deltaproteobacteria bacterium]|nr:MAG: hypothetical protein EP330_09185 [Deltaproteobacteria bacterium]